MSNYWKIFDTTTSTRSSSIGQPGFDDNADWIHFFDKYRNRCLRFARARFPSRPDLAEDALQDVSAKIRVNPNILHRKPSKRFRAVIATLVRNAVVEALRKEKSDRLDVYVEQTEAFRENFDTQERNRHRLRILVIDFIRRDLMREDYENGRFALEHDTLDLDIWRARQREDASDSSVAREMGFSSGTKVKDAVARVEERMMRDAENLLASLGLI